MTDRKNIKIAAQTYERARDLKGEWETWDGFLQRAFDELEADDD